MTNPFLRSRSRSGVVYFRIVEPTTHYRIVDGRVFRDCLVELPDGRREVRGVREDVAA